MGTGSFFSFFQVLVTVTLLTMISLCKQLSYWEHCRPELPPHYAVDIRAGISEILKHSYPAV